MHEAVRKWADIERAGQSYRKKDYVSEFKGKGRGKKGKNKGKYKGKGKGKENNAQPKAEAKAKAQAKAEFVNTLATTFSQALSQTFNKEKVPVRAMVTKGKVKGSPENRRTIPKLNVGPAGVYISQNCGRRAHVPMKWQKQMELPHRISRMGCVALTG